MNVLHKVSTLALLVGFGFAGAALPAAAQQGQALESEQQVEELSRSERQAAPAVCDADGNGYISVTEAENCAERGYDDWIGQEEQAMSQERFREMYPDVEDGETAFSRIDSDGDGQISREEWTEWQRQSFAGATGQSGGEMTAEEYESWWEGGLFE